MDLVFYSKFVHNVRPCFSYACSDINILFTIWIISSFTDGTLSVLTAFTLIPRTDRVRQFTRYATTYLDLRLLSSGICQQLHHLPYLSPRSTPN